MSPIETLATEAKALVAQGGFKALTMRIGGITGWMRSAAIAGAAGLPLSSHFYTGLSAQVLRVSESADWLEWSDWAEPVLAEPFLARDGIATMPSVPGNGIEWNEVGIAKSAI